MLLILTFVSLLVIILLGRKIRREVYEFTKIKKD